jgi:hypothetical protein
VVNSALYEGTLMHSRREPKRHVFTYPISYWLLDLDELLGDVPLGQVTPQQLGDRLGPRPRSDRHRVRRAREHGAQPCHSA